MFVGYILDLISPIRNRMDFISIGAFWVARSYDQDIVFPPFQFLDPVLIPEPKFKRLYAGLDLLEVNVFDGHS